MYQHRNAEQARHAERELGQPLSGFNNGSGKQLSEIPLPGLYRAKTTSATFEHGKVSVAGDIHACDRFCTFEVRISQFVTRSPRPKKMIYNDICRTYHMGMMSRYNANTPFPLLVWAKCCRRVLAMSSDAPLRVSPTFAIRTVMHEFKWTRTQQYVGSASGNSHCRLQPRLSRVFQALASWTTPIDHSGFVAAASHHVQKICKS